MIRQLLRGFRVLFLAAVAAFLPSAHAAWGDVSYDPTPARIDEDKAAMFDGAGVLMDAVVRSIGGMSARQDFESGFINAQVLTDWVRLGDNRVRFGFGDSLTRIDWRGRIGQIDPGATEFGLFHPHGTYGNVAGVAGDPRNYIFDHYFLTADSPPGAAKPYFVMQFERPIIFVGLSIGDYTGAVGGSSHFDLLVGDDLASAAALPEYGHRPDMIWPPDLLDDGGFLPLVGIGKGVWSPSVSNRYPRFNFAVLRLDPADPTVAFDNLIVVNAVPQPDVLALLLAGLGALAATWRRSPART
ncbi:PEP-CTERM sorting domain-containing protein [Candidatus Accumulibacter vicinus]|uniref:PEP-CTERM protein-sorting domain-containing protein n=1 Tax=Candidatus Accumulibacter vicinus TaxID=2954382 RepID=A0A084Y2P4_9PROT|nr:PEP-CTERM sorting domain-containing protein [Candidatus Accumulibacter vicinus]KFB68988.1 MAG: hypothetical protein CAPSK01_001177 [Candidatus Accumulibacter vicinus]